MSNEQQGIFPLTYTGHPLVDVGLATIAAIAGRDELAEVTADDLEAVAQRLETEFVVNPLQSFLTVAFTSNAWFIQHAFNPERADLTEEKRHEVRATRQKWANAHLRQWKTEGDPTQRCVFTGLPAVAEVLSGKLPAGRAARTQIPLMQGDDSINFFPNGNAGLPVSGIAVLALQAFPLGSAKAGNGLLVVHSDNPELTTRYAKKFLTDTVKAIAFAHQTNQDKVPAAKRSPRTLLIETLLEIESHRQYDEYPATITAYNLNNGKTPQLGMYELPHNVVGFILEANASYPQAWQKLVSRAWEQTSTKQKGVFEPKRNYVYEDVFNLPAQARPFIRTYFLRLPTLAYRSEQDPRTSYSLRNEHTLVDFRLVELFVRRILLMDTVRIERIKRFGDKLANYVRAENGKRFFRLFAGENNYYVFRQQLIRANENFVRTGGEPLFSVDEYVDIFERQYQKQAPNWRLARDLVLIRMIEQLKDWLHTNTDALPERTDSVPVDESTTSEEE